MIHSDEHKEKPTVKTVKSSSNKEQLEAEADVASDPARTDHIGIDWTDEGGATPEGPATTSEHR